MTIKILYSSERKNNSLSENIDPTDELSKAHHTDSGYDIQAYLQEEITINPREAKLIPTGIRLNMPYGIEGQIRPRSGLANKHGITVLNSPGTIDNGYHGEIKVILVNTGNKAFTVKDGMRIAQLIFANVLDTELIWTKYINYDSERGTKGFGSSGL